MHRQQTGGGATSLLELCQSHTTCRSLILTLAGAVHAAASGHAAAAARQLLQLAGEGNYFLFVLFHQLEAETESKMHRYTDARLIKGGVSFSKNNATS